MSARRPAGDPQGDPSARGSLRVLRALPVALMVYVLLLGITQIWIQTTSEHGEIERLRETEWLGLRLPAWLGVVHGLWALLMVFELLRARRSPPGLRRGHLAGAATGLLLVFALCWWTWLFASS